VSLAERPGTPQSRNGERRRRKPTPTPPQPGNLWLAKALLDLGAVRFGSFTMGRTTVESPVYVNVRLLISAPRVLQRTARVMDQEITADLLRQEPRIEPFDLVAGIPLGGLHLAAAFSLRTKVPMIYATPDGPNGEPVIEGRYRAGQSVLLIDDLITTGGSVLETGPLLQQAGLRVGGVFVLVDRGQGAARRLQQHGYHLMTLLNLRVMLNYYMSTGAIEEEWYRRSIAYLDEHPALPT